MNVFSRLLSFFKLRESGKQNLGVKEECPKVTYLIFLTGFHWRISLLSRANRLCTVFNAGLRDSGLSCLSLLSLAPEWNGYRPSATRLVQKLPFFVFTSVEGKGTPLPFGVPPPIIWLHFLFPLPMSGDPRSLRYEHLCDPHSLITVTFWLLDNFSSTGGRVSFPPPRLREPSRDNSLQGLICHKLQPTNQFFINLTFLLFIILKYSMNSSCLTFPPFWIILFLKHFLFS